MIFFLFCNDLDLMDLTQLAGQVLITFHFVKQLQKCAVYDDGIDILIEQGVDQTGSAVKALGDQSASQLFFQLGNDFVCIRSILLFENAISQIS